MKLHPTTKRFWIPLSLAFFALFILDLTTGSIFLSFDEIIKILTSNLTSDETASEIVFDFRLPKALTCILAGAALASGGLQMQTLFRNPLAGPDVFGLSSGASLAVALVVLTAHLGFGFNLPGNWIIAIAASAGSALVALFVLIFSFRVRDHASLLIIGLMIGAGTGSLVSVLEYTSRAEDQQSYLIWTFGSLGGLNWQEIVILATIFLTGFIIAIASTRSLNVWILGENYVRSLGINTTKARILMIISTSLLTGGVTAFCGPIAFVGLAVPHLTKILVKSGNHQVLLPAVALSGACLMLLCDILTQLPRTAHILPINAITALIGAPVVIWVIMRRRKIATP